MQQDEQIDLTADGERTETRSARPRYRLEELVRQITPGNQPETIDVPPVGEELL